MDKNGGLWFYWQAIGTAQWNPEQLTATYPIASASVAQVGDSAVIAALSTVNTLWFYWQMIGTAAMERRAGGSRRNSGVTLKDFAADAAETVAFRYGSDSRDLRKTAQLCKATRRRVGCR